MRDLGLKLVSPVIPNRELRAYRCLARPDSAWIGLNRTDNLYKFNVEWRMGQANEPPKAPMAISICDGCTDDSATSYQLVAAATPYRLSRRIAGHPQGKAKQITYWIKPQTQRYRITNDSPA